jgi:hypothetical protein
MWDAPFFPSLPPSDRLRLQADEIRHVGPEPWIAEALDYPADELEFSDSRLHEGLSDVESLA